MRSPPRPHQPRPAAAPAKPPLRLHQLVAEGGRALQALDFAQAEAVAREAAALTLAPGFSRRPGSGFFEAQYNLAVILQALGRLEEAEQAWRKLLRQVEAGSRQAATARMGIAEVLLAQGRYAEAWPHYEARHQQKAQDPRPATAIREWKGEDIRGKRLAIMVEQGFGDQIQLARFAPWLQGQGIEVTLACKPALARTFEGLGVPLAPGVRQPNGDFTWNITGADYWVMAMSIPYRARVTLENVPNAPYLPTPAAVPLPPGAWFGVVTRGDPAHANDAARSLPPDMGAQIMGLPGAFSLQPEDTRPRDFHDTASAIAGLDLVVTVDTAVAHLAGAMGKPVWILLPAYNTDWRWMRGRADSPWYPSAKLYRQERPGVWASVVDRVKADLGDLAGRRG